MLFIVIAALQLSVKAQVTSDTTLRKNCIKINLLSPIVSAVNLAVEIQTKKDYSFQLGVVYMNHATYGTTDGVTKAFFVTPEFRYQIANTRGGYAFVGAFARYINMEYSQSERKLGTTLYSTARYESVGFGVLIGQKVIYRNRVAFEFFVGPVYSGIVSAKNDFFNRGSDDIIIDQDIPYTLLRRYGLRSGFTIGWMF